MISRCFYATLALAIVLLFSGCSDDPISIVKNGYLSDHPTTTVGKAFDNYSYLTNIKWRTETLANGIRTVTVGAIVPRAKLDKGKFIAPINIENVDSALLEFTFTLNADDTFYLDTKRLVYIGKNLQKDEYQALKKECSQRGKMIEMGCEVNWKPTKLDLERLYKNGLPII